MLPLGAVIAWSLLVQTPTSLPSDCAVPSGLPERALSPAEIEALRASRIEAAARITGSIVDRLPPPEGVVRRLDAMAARSDTVVMATVHDSICHVAPDGRTIMTHFVIQVDEAVKGTLHTGERVVVQVRGGRVVFSGGAVAETRVRSTEPMKRGARYVLFLTALPPPGGSAAQAAAADRRTFRPTFDGYSVFELTSGGRVRPALTVPFARNVASDYRDRPVPDFLAIVRALRKP